MTVTDPISAFDGKTISYTYDNGWSFTNRFEGHLRITEVPVRGVLREHVEVVLLRPDLYFVSWVDGEMGPIGQILDLQNRTVIAAIPGEDGTRTEILNGSITAFDT